MKNFLFWLIAFVITISSAIYQRMTGPTHPVRGKIVISDTEIKYRLKRSHGGETDHRVAINISDDKIAGVLQYKRYKTDDPWTDIPMKKEMDQLNYLLETAQRDADFQKVAEIKYGKIPNLLKEIKKAEKKLVGVQKKHKILKEEVTEEDVAQVVSRWTGIPVTRLIEEEAKKLERMEEIIAKRVVGQQEAIKAVANAIRRSRAGISEEKRERKLS